MSLQTGLTPDEVRARLHELRQHHRDLDSAIESLERAGNAGQLQVRRLKKQKLDDRHPYILLDSNKCILCGRCVRYCGDLIGVHALGFINRGYDTVVKPALDKPLAETTCISCGNCSEVCPTGAITFKADLDKPGPFRTVPHRSVCSFCGVGCEIDVTGCRSSPSARPRFARASPGGSPSSPGRTGRG